jgi:hypothetical protein
VLSNHKHGSFKNNYKGQKSNNYNNYIEKEVTSKEKEELPKMSLANIEDKCYCYCKPGHRSPVCPHLIKTSKTQWVIHKDKDNDKESSFIVMEAKHKEN